MDYFDLCAATIIIMGTAMILYVLMAPLGRKD